MADIWDKKLNIALIENVVFQKKIIRISYQEVGQWKNQR